jgi:hypothetical protein
VLEEDPITLYDPAATETHADCELAPAETEYFPTGHAVGLIDPAGQ